MKDLLNDDKLNVVTGGSASYQGQGSIPSDGVVGHNYTSITSNHYYASVAIIEQGIIYDVIYAYDTPCGLKFSQETFFLTDVGWASIEPRDYNQSQAVVKVNYPYELNIQP